jgi:hypothetical protein
VIISILNRSMVADRDVRKAVRAINRQIAEHFEPAWDLSGTLRLATSGETLRQLEKRGHAIVHLRNRPPRMRPPGLHDTTGGGTIAAVIYTELPALVRSRDPWLVWTADLSHEVLELIADPELNTLVKGPHPVHPRHEVFHYREVCDPVEATSYHIDGVAVSNFLLPHYYNADGERGGRNDFLKTGVEAFRWIEGGGIGFWDPAAGRRGAYVTFPKAKPHEARYKRERIKGAFSRLRRYARRIGR